METPNPTPTPEATPATSTPPVTPAPATTPTPVVDAPTFFAGKYKSVEELEAGYKALETRLGAPAPTQEATPAPTAEATPADPGQATVETTPEAKSILAQAGIDFDVLSKEYLDNGGLTPESLAKLETAGFPKSVVDNYVAGAQASAQAVLTDIYNHSGGEEAFKSVLEWGGANMTEAEISAFNAALDSPDINATKMAIDGVRARMAAAGTEPTLISPTNTNGAPTPSAGFKSQTEMSAAINARDERGRQKYGNDPVYTAEVEAKMKASTFL